MLTSIKQRTDREDEGFTLIELMVVLLIIAILLAIAIPTFLGTRNTANARSMQENLRNALTAEQTYWTQNQAFTATPASLQAIEPSLNWTTAAATTGAEGGNTVSVSIGDNNDMVLVQGLAKDGNCYAIEASNDPAVTTNTTGYAESSGACTYSSTPAFVTVTSGAATAATTGSGGTFYQSW